MQTSEASTDEAVWTFPGARAPDRRGWVDASGLRLAVYEWGEPDAPPVLLVHGALDFARTFDGFAPLLADAGYRVVSYDHRGHGDSDHADLYNWVADVRDMLAVADSITRAPLLAVGHSKGGSLLVQAIQALPHRFTRFAAIDGLPFRSPHADSAVRERKSSLTGPVIARWLDARRRSAELERRPGTLEELASRRARMNPRLSHEWLCYIASHGARRDAQGWRWKLDPAIGVGGFGPMRVRWMTDRLPGFPIPMLAIFGSEKEPMGWDATADDLMPFFPTTTEVHRMQDVGHFIHIERPQETASRILQFFGA
ncbi:alpha/beta fold hydrolase [Cupriavidus gilardii]|uniref:alpha/beta fold hydrolase n=1 Tax=Cupriavidus gilardii TaxID=82541 RepID=UPI001ABDD9A0|nr:alpha/beta fold hydrolase [Cupriavidus gilardii]MBO4122667.1 alpha/beta fold hydrolase [Cupriavidus gilardii]